ncbi:hypothetical protein [Rhizobium sp. PL01]|uniref:hypothetical protein n=1 Tax=Rhizobium sp. PL01 TaxID=3085631 RepID=UPI0029810400|nr:hypothetical protein [Rhizobium sp. PL01]MDW5314986.1 hypothetical protein [Rhizobium sp. PL01]
MKEIEHHGSVAMTDTPPPQDHLVGMQVTARMVDACIEANTRAKLFGGEPREWVRVGIQAALAVASEDGQ